MSSQNPFDYQEMGEAAKASKRTFRLVLLIIVIGLVAAYCTPAPAFQAPKAPEPEWQIVDPKICASKLAVGFVVRSIFAKADMHGPLITLWIRKPDDLDVFQVTKRGAGFTFETRWRPPLGFCLHSFRSRHEANP